VTILAIDTCEANCSAALLLEGGESFACTESLGRGHAERLIPMIEELLRKAGVAYGDIRRIAVATGPGSFTGLRIGLSVARGLSLSLDVPCIGLSSLMVLAAHAPVVSGPVHAVIKGRGGQVFYQGFEGIDPGGLPKPLGMPANLDADDAHQAIESLSGYVLGSGVPLIMGREAGPADDLNPVTLARMAYSLEADDFPPEPFYLRAADAVKAKPLIRISKA